MLRQVRWAWVLLLSTVLWLASCGGGGLGDVQANGSGVGSGGTGSYTNGPISGLGSIIVNNVRYDVAGARLHRDDDADDSVVHAPDDLKLGMVVEVQGSDILPASAGGTPVASASLVRYGSSLVGLVSAVDMLNSTITVLNQTVRFTAKTVMPPAVAVNDVVEVHGLIDAAGAYTATRMDVVSTNTFKIVGEVQAVDGQFIYMGAGGNLAVAFQATGLPQGLVPGVRARIWFGATKVNGQWSATRLRVDSALTRDSDEASLEGLVTVLPVAGTMRVDGTLVDVSRLGGLPSLLLGQRVRVEGRLQAGVLIATELSLENEQELEAEDVELHGQVSQLGSQTFVMRGVVVSYSPAVVHGSRALADGVCAEVHGRSYNANRELVADEIDVKDSCD